MGTLHAFDLLEDDAGPVVSEVCPPVHDKRGVFQEGRGRGRKGTAGPEESGIGEEKRGEARGGQALPGTVEWKRSSGSGSPREFSLPVLALSSDTLATGSRPKVAVSVRGNTFTRGLSRQMFRPPPPPLETAVGGRRERREGGERGVVEETSGGERKRMEEWLGQIL